MRDTKLLTFIRYQFEEKAFEAQIIQFKYIISEVASSIWISKKIIAPISIRQQVSLNDKMQDTKTFARKIYEFRNPIKYQGKNSFNVYFAQDIKMTN